MWALTLTEVPVFQEKPNLPRFKKKPKNCDKIFNNIFLLDHFWVYNRVTLSTFTMF